MRTNTYSRFDESIPEEVVVGRCSSCSSCIYKGQDVYKYENSEVFCDTHCLFNYLDIRQEQIYTN